MGERVLVTIHEKRRELKARDDGRCPICGNYRAACSPMGRRCCYFGELLVTTGDETND